MVERFAGRVAVVTGGTSGIGLATAKAFAAEGATVFITGRRQDGIDAALEAIGGTVIGGKLIGIRADTSKAEELDRLYDSVRDTSGRIDVIFANAGIAEMAPLGAISEEHYESAFDINVRGVLFTVQKALPLLKDGGSIILMSSTTAVSGTPGFSGYSATKAAVRSFARTWIMDLKDRHIRVNAVSPGLIDTPGLTTLFGGGEQADGAKTYLASLVPAGRVGQPVEVAKAVLFLASDEASYVNGIELFVDGGQVQV